MYGIDWNHNKLHLLVQQTVQAAHSLKVVMVLWLRNVERVREKGSFYEEEGGSGSGQ